MILLERIAVTWKFRKAPLEECTEDFIVFMERLKRLDSRFDKWYEKGWNRKKASQNKIVFSYDYIKQQFCKDRNASDNPDFSFRISFWNGAKTEAESFGISVSLGGNTEIENNNCILSFPYEGEIYEHYLIKENRDQLLDLFIDHWDPDQVLHDGKWIDL